MGNRSKPEKSFKSAKVKHNFCGHHKNKPLVLNKKLGNLKMNKVKISKSVLQHKVCDIGGSTGDIFKQLHLSILHSFNLSFQ